MIDGIKDLNDRWRNRTEPTPEFKEWWDGHKDNPVTMQCQKCKQEFLESEVQLSHDVPKYVGGTDKDGRHLLCKRCHDIYERLVFHTMISTGTDEQKAKMREAAKAFSKGYFK